MKVYTASVTGILTITRAMGVMQMSVLMGTSSDADLSGNQAVSGLPTPNAINLTDGQGFNLTAVSSNSPIDGVVLTVNSGSADVILTLDL